MIVVIVWINKSPLNYLYAFVNIHTSINCVICEWPNIFVADVFICLKCFIFATVPCNNVIP